MPISWCVPLKKFLEKLAERIDYDTNAYQNYQRRVCVVPERELPLQSEAKKVLRAARDKRVIACLGDGSFQNWSHVSLVNAIDNGEGKCWTTKVCPEKVIISAMERIKRDEGIACAL
ncbi:hypothetical protein JCGZ_11732 [Jatropha curcas]|uniref:Uncharacterized protein n=1 Tax=Jatropha curcas TaxID=180498 RepID=A0A067K553_JATCU|nr:hypothetical protein JCGZ_11732 [Jatropha curcas]